MNRHSIRMYWRQRREGLCQWAANKLPRRVLYFAVLRGISIATSGLEHGHIEVPGVKAMDVVRVLGGTV